MLHQGASHRADRYAACGQVLADTAEGIGMSAKNLRAIEWEETMFKLASADDLSETNVDFFSNPSILLEHLNLDPNNEKLADAAGNLLAANIKSHKALKISDHFNARSSEASETINLLRHQAVDSKLSDEVAWRQLSALAITGIHLDSFFDALEDSKRLLQFTESQLSIGALTSLIKSSRLVKTSTWIELHKASHKAGLDTYISGKISRHLNSPKQLLVSSQD